MDTHYTVDANNSPYSIQRNTKRELDREKQRKKGQTGHENLSPIKKNTCRVRQKHKGTTDRDCAQERYSLRHRKEIDMLDEMISGYVEEVWVVMVWFIFN